MIMSEKISNIPDEITNKTYGAIRNSVIMAQNKIYITVNAAMVEAYWEIGERIYISCGESGRAEYGKNLLKYLSGKLTSPKNNIQIFASMRLNI